MPTTDRITRHFIGAVPDEWQLYSDNAADYTIGAPIGFGASSIVYQAEFTPQGQGSQPVPCALKVLDLDRLPQHPLRLLQRETQLMSLSKHPNVLRVRGTWMAGHKLYIALRLMNSGSAADVMHYGWPGGMEEDVVKCILKQALEGLNYLHINGFIHRDVKAANLLIDDDGTVLLGDLGVAAFLGDNDDTTSTTTSKPSHSRPGMIGKRKSFVGTPCWMAPEVINRKQYDASADIWSFGITALELAQGRAPRSREPPHSVLLHIVTHTPPVLDREAGPHKYSRAFQEIVERCLNKDPAKRPSAAELLQTPFFKGARKKGYLVGTILKGLPPIASRQERRKQPSIISPRTMDSWDFSGTSVPASPTTSIYGAPGHRPHTQHHHAMERLWSELESIEGEKEKEQGKEGETSENGGRAEGGATDAERVRGRRITAQHAPRPHSVSHFRGPSINSTNSASRHSQRGESAGERESSGSVSWARESDEPSSSKEVISGLERMRTASPEGLSSPSEIPAQTQTTADDSQASTQDHRSGLEVAEPLPPRSTTSSPSEPGMGTTPPGSSSKLWRRITGIGRDDESNSGESIRKSKRVFSGVLGGKRISSSSD